MLSNCLLASKNWVLLADLPDNAQRESFFDFPVTLRSPSSDNNASCKSGGNGRADTEKCQYSDQASSPQLKLPPALDIPSSYSLVRLAIDVLRRGQLAGANRKSRNRSR